MYTDTDVELVAEALWNDRYPNMPLPPEYTAAGATWRGHARAALESMRRRGWAPATETAEAIARTIEAPKLSLSDPTPEELTRQETENTGAWPEKWGPHHRHFASDAIHRDGKPECDQPGTQHRVYVFDADYLDAHERFIADRERAACAKIVRDITRTKEADHDL